MSWSDPLPTLGITSERDSVDGMQIRMDAMMRHFEFVLASPTRQLCCVMPDQMQTGWPHGVVLVLLQSRDQCCTQIGGSRTY